MTDDADTPGTRIARARRRRGLSQTVVAGLIGRSESWLSQVERGVRRVDSHAVLLRLADVLHVEVEELTGPRDGSGEGQWRVYGPATQIEQAILCYDGVGTSISGPPTVAVAGLGTGRRGRAAPTGGIRRRGMTTRAGRCLR
jgi:DNA-binding XRE family transcriptional regulator